MLYLLLLLLLFYIKKFPGQMYLWEANQNYFIYSKLDGRLCFYV